MKSTSSVIVEVVDQEAWSSTASRADVSVFRGESNIKGREREEQFFKAFTLTHFKYPDYFLGVRWATLDEDGKGIDFMLKTLHGEIPINIKCSRKLLKKHRKMVRRYPERKRIIPLVIKETDSAYIILQNLFKEVDIKFLPP